MCVDHLYLHLASSLHLLRSVVVLTPRYKITKDRKWLVSMEIINFLCWTLDLRPSKKSKRKEFYGTNNFSIERDRNIEIINHFAVNYWRYEDSLDSFQLLWDTKLYIVLLTRSPNTTLTHPFDVGSCSFLIFDNDLDTCMCRPLDSNEFSWPDF